MMTHTMRFVSLMKDSNKLSKDFKKVGKISKEILKKNPNFSSHEISLLWTFHPENVDKQDVFYQGIQKFPSYMGLGSSKGMILAKQVFLDKGRFEQEGFFTEEQKKDLKEARMRINDDLKKVESKIQNIFSALESRAQDRDFISWARSLFEESRDSLKRIEGGAVQEVKSLIEEALHILGEPGVKKAHPKGTIKKILDVLKRLRPLELDKEDAETYKTELSLRGDELALSNILISSVAAKSPGIYINLEAISDDDISNIVKRFAKDTAKSIEFNQKGDIVCIRSTKENRSLLREINHERSQRYKLLSAQVTNSQSLNIQMNLLEEPVKNANTKNELQAWPRTLQKDPKVRDLLYRVSPRGREIFTVKENYDVYTRGGLTSEMTGETLSRDVETLLKPQTPGFFARIKAFFKSLFGFKTKFSVPGKSHLIVYSENKSKSKAQRLYKEDPKNSILYRYDHTLNKLIFEKAGAVENERQLRFAALYKKAGFDRYTAYGDSIISLDEVERHLSKGGVSLRNNKLTELEKKVLDEIPREIPSDFGEMRIGLLSEKFEDVKKHYKQKGIEVDWDKVARSLFEKEGEALFISFKDEVGIAGVNGRILGGWSPLHQAAKSIEFVKILVEEYEDTDLDIENDQGAPPVFEAAGFGRIEVVKYLYEKGANLQTKDHEGNNILHRVVEEHHPDQPGRNLTQIMDYLVKRGLDPGERNISGKSALDLAIKQRKYDLVELLDPMNLRAVMYNQLSKKADDLVDKNPSDELSLEENQENNERFKKLLARSLREDLEKNTVLQRQASLDEDVESGYEDIDEIRMNMDESDYATVEEFKVERKVSSQDKLESGTESDYVGLDQIKFTKEFGRLAKMLDNLVDRDHFSLSREQSFESGYGSDDDQDSLQLDVPGDGDCALHSIASSYLIPFAHNDNEFNLRYHKLFGNLKDVKELQDLAKTYDPAKSKDNLLYGKLWKSKIEAFRGRLVNHMSEERDKYKDFFAYNNEEDHNAKSYDDYLDKMRKPGVYLSDIDISAASNFLSQPIKVKKANNDSKELIYNGELGGSPLELYHLGSGKQHGHYNFGLDIMWGRRAISESSLLRKLPLERRQEKGRRHTISSFG